MTRTLALSLASITLLAFGCGEDEPREPEQQPASEGDAGAEADAGAGQTAGTAGQSSGGSGGTAGASGSGGKKLLKGEFGVFPKTVTAEDAEAAYDSWKDDYVEECGANGARVIGNAPDETLAEGIGFGALLSVAWNDKETFDGLFKFYTRAAGVSDSLGGTKYGLMGWFVGIDPCEMGEVYPGAAVGADLNMAMALLQAECVWGGGSYQAGAVKIMDSIRKNASKEADGRTVLLATAGLAADDSPCSNPSYFSPAYYRVFAKVQPEQADFWNGFADDSLSLLAEVSETPTHLAPDWAPNSSETCPSHDGYVGYDGIRTIWRVATEYNWFGTAAAKDWLDAVTGYMSTEVGADQLLDVKDGFFTDGEGLLLAPGQGNSAFVGAIANGTIAGPQATADSFHQVLIDLPPGNDGSYYTDTARAIHMLLSVNKFSPGCY